MFKTSVGHCEDMGSSDTEMRAGGWALSNSDSFVTAFIGER